MPFSWMKKNSASKKKRKRMNNNNGIKADSELRPEPLPYGYENIRDDHIARYRVLFETVK